jgi:hypothetical protein
VVEMMIKLHPKKKRQRKQLLLNLILKQRLILRLNQDSLLLPLKTQFRKK